MASDTFTTQPATGPSRVQVALAIAIVRAKLPGISVREYILQLRGQVKRGQHGLMEQDRSRYLDLVTYWQAKCKQIQDENDELKKINTKLERANLALVGRETPDLTFDLPPIPSKRKKDAASPTRQSKRTRPSHTNPSQSIENTQETIDGDLDFLDGLSSDGAILMQALYSEHKLCRQLDPDPEALCYSLVQTLTALGRILMTVAKNHDQLSRSCRKTPESLAKDKSELSYALAVSARTFMSVLVGLKKFDDVGRGRRLPSLVSYEAVKMFKTALQAIETAARQTATVQPTSPSKKKGNRKTSGPVKESLPARSLAHFLATLISFLDKNTPDHQQMFDGFVYVLLERVGKRLFYCTFGHNRNATIDGDIALIHESQTPAEIARQEIDALAIRLEVKALVLILQRAMGLAPNHMNPQVNKASKGPNHLNRTLSMKNLPTTSKTRLSALAKDRLQRTLITCMFGEKVEDEFLDVLTMPIPAVRATSLPNFGRLQDDGVEDWFKEQVWKLVGWDLLGRESGW